jgi:hypothetical protein
MGIGNKNSNRSKELKLAQLLHCKKVKPWRKSTGPRTAEGKRKVTQNLPHGKGETSRVAQELNKLDEALKKLQRLEERIQRRQLTAIQKLEKLAKKAKTNDLN